jgi:hypothetical protein
MAEPDTGLAVTAAPRNRRLIGGRHFYLIVVKVAVPPVGYPLVASNPVANACSGMPPLECPCMEEAVD